MESTTPIRLLIVENQPLAARLLTVLVRRLGYHPVGPVATADKAAALQHALELALLNFRAGHTAPLPAALTEPDDLADNSNLRWNHDVLLSHCIFLRDRGRLVKVCLTDIQYIESGDKYCTLVTATGRYLSRQPLRELALELPAQQFVQIQRYYLVNVAFIESFDEGQTSVVVAGAALPLSHSYRDALLNRLRLVG